MAINLLSQTYLAAISSLTIPMSSQTLIFLLLFSGFGFGFVAGYFFRPSLEERRYIYRLDRLSELLHQKDRRITYLENLLRKINAQNNNN
jgi:hypothetical protein